jgi:DNA-binding HxlR family transcriptional regulator
MIETIAAGLWRRLRDAALAERRLEAFAFSETPEPAPPAARAPDEAALGALARDVTLRAVAAAADPMGYRVLAELGPGPVALAALARATALPPLALTERLGALAQAGLATRALERDEAEATEAGRALVTLLDGIASAVAARCRAGLDGSPWRP